MNSIDFGENSSYENFKAKGIVRLTFIFLSFIANYNSKLQC
jgi:hypothetical protein